MSWRNRSREPVGHTCPQIDKLLSHLGACVGYEFTQGDLAFATSEIEALRTDNSVLRAWGNKEQETADEHEKNAADLEDELNRLKQDHRETVEDLEGQIMYLQERIEALQSQSIT